MANTGNGAAITFATSGVSMDVAVIGELTITLPVLQDDHLGTTKFISYRKGDLLEVAPLNVEVYWDPDDSQLIADTLVDPDSAHELVTISAPYPFGTTSGTKSNFNGTGFINEVTTPSFENNTVMRGSYAIQFDGKTTELNFAPLV